MLQAWGQRKISRSCSSPFPDDTPAAKLIRQVLGAVSEFEKAMVVSKLKGARERKRATGRRSRAGGTTPRSTQSGRPGQEAAAVQGRKRTLREIACELAKAGFVTGTGRPYSAAAVAKIIEA
ncbi:hypothetical protein [Microvirga sp. G4-2]|uniref:hypothetical protein n=1 Tax=Microvirga sp. G4-2 TaxID=3434467 RepID=UPI0040449D7C